jgi:prepilin-type N-terminal cleavage/methylation domain
MCRRSSNAFTLVEIMVAIAIIAAMSAVLMPVFGAARERGRTAACASNLRQIATALLLYAQDADERFPADCPAAPVRGGDSPAMPYDRQILPYLKSGAVFHCPSDAVTRTGDMVWDGDYRGKCLPRSYALSNALRTAASAARGEEVDRGTGAVGRALAAVDAPAGLILLSETWSEAPEAQGLVSDSVIAFAGGSTLAGCDAWKLPGRKPGADAAVPGCEEPMADPARRPARGHFGRGLYAFADGHVAPKSWDQVRADDFALFRARL